MLPCSKLNKTFLGYFDPENTSFDFRGELTDNSARKEALTCFPLKTSSSHPFHGILKLKSSLVFLDFFFVPPSSLNNRGSVNTHIHLSMTR